MQQTLVSACEFEVRDGSAPQGTLLPVHEDDRKSASAEQIVGESAIAEELPEGIGVAGRADGVLGQVPETQVQTEADQVASDDHQTEEAEDIIDAHLGEVGDDQQTVREAGTEQGEGGGKGGVSGQGH